MSQTSHSSPSHLRGSLFVHQNESVLHGFIVEKKQLAPRVYAMIIAAPRTVHNAAPGQFVNIIAHSRGKTVPLTIADLDREQGTLTIVFQAVGVSTMRLAVLDVGDTLYSVRGPLGHASDIRKFTGAVVCVAGGVGIAPMYPVIRALKQAGNTTVLILGAREERSLFWEDRVRPYADEMIVCTDIGHTRDHEGTVVGPLTEILDTRSDAISHVFGVGPLPLLAAITKMTVPRNISFVASAVALMIDGTGMCYGCQYREKASSETFLLCRDGPEVNGNTIDWDTLSARLNQYRPEEQRAVEQFMTTPEYAQFLAQESHFAEGS